MGCACGEVCLQATYVRPLGLAANCQRRCFSTLPSTCDAQLHESLKSSPQQNHQIDMQRTG
eukprot:4378366-Amphidinium_carterae.2